MLLQKALINQNRILQMMIKILIFLGLPNVSAAKLELQKKMFHMVCLFNSCAWVKTLQLSKSTHPNLWLSYLQRIRLITDLLLIYIWWLYCVWMLNSSNEARGMKAVRNSLLALTLETIRRKAARDAVWMFILSFFVPSLLFGLV